MFHPLSGNTLIRFSFYSALTDSTSIQIGLTEDQAFDDTYHTLDGTGNRILLTTRQDDDNRRAVQLIVYGDGNSGDEVISRTIVPSIQLDMDAWYEGIIRLDDDNTVTFGYRRLSEPNFTLFTGNPVPPDFDPQFVGVTLYGPGRLDNIGIGIPEPSALLLGAMASVVLCLLRRR